MITIAHRGASGYEPENTLAAFQKALDLKADMIELDVRQCKSGEIVVIHDATVNRTTTGSGKVKNLTLDQLKALDAGNGQKIPTLDETLHLIKDKALININVKDGKALEKTLQLIKQHTKKHELRPEDIIISAEKLGILRDCYDIDEAAIVPSFVMFPRLFLRFSRKLNASAIELYDRVVSKSIVNIAHAVGFQVYVWTVNDPEKIKEMKAIGVDGIITDYPDRV